MEQFILLHGTFFFSSISLFLGAGHSKLCAQRPREPSGLFFSGKRGVGGGKKSNFCSLFEIKLFRITSKNDRILTFSIETSTLPVELGMPLIELGVADPRECFVREQIGFQ